MVPLFSVFSSIIGGLGGINQVQIRVLMAYSSINYLGWTMAASAISFFGLSIHYIVYFSYFSIFVLIIINYRLWAGLSTFWINNK